MSMRRLLLLAFSCALVVAIAAFAQQHSGSRPAHKQQPANPPQHRQQPAPAEPGGQQQGHAGQGEAQPRPPHSVQEELAEASREAAGEEEQENAGFKQSKVVRSIASATGMSPKLAYWVLYSLDFAIIAALIVWFWKSNLPAAFRARTESIRKGMDEAQRASAEANRRLSDVQSRLARLQEEIAEMRASAEAEAAGEEQRIRAAAEEDTRKIVAAAEAEIDAAAKAARRELKAYAAELAVALAEKRIRVDANTDQALVRSFVSQLASSDTSSRRNGE